MPKASTGMFAHGLPLARMRAEGATIAGSVAEVVGGSSIVFLCLPSAKHARAVFEGDGILKNIRKGQIVVDLGTATVFDVISAKGFGDTHPVAPNDTPANRAKNRRIVITVQGPGAPGA